MGTGAAINPSNITDEEELASFVDDIKKSSGTGYKLLPLLKEQHPMYDGKSANAVTRMRGYIMQAFWLTGLPDEALIYVYEELESDREAYLVAAAAIALRGAKTRRFEMASYVLTAIHNIKFYDKPISFERYTPKWPLRKYTTAIYELIATLNWLGCYAKPYLADLAELKLNADHSLGKRAISLLGKAIQSIGNDDTVVDTGCCNSENSCRKFNPGEILDASTLKHKVANVCLEDHEGQKLPFKDAFTQKYTLVAFFYTRCDNPLKCSLTISNMANLQKLFSEEGLSQQINLAAITYDSNYDLPFRIKIYGEARGLKLNESARMFRVTSGYKTLKQYFDLGVNYTGEVVNRHIIELYLLDEHGNISMSFQRQKIDNQDIISHIKDVLSTKKGEGIKRSRLKIAWQNFSSIVFPTLVLFLPKCPLCFAAYFSLLGITGMQLLPYAKFVFPIIILIIGINLYSIFRAAKQRNGFLPFYLCAFGALLVLLFGHFILNKYGMYSGLFLLFTGSVLNSLPFMAYLKLKSRFFSLS